MGLPAILMLACARAATIAAGTTTATPDPTVGWQPPSALPFGPALLGGNETALLMARAAWMASKAASSSSGVAWSPWSTASAWLSTMWAMAGAAARRGEDAGLPEMAARQPLSGCVADFGRC